MKSAAHRFPKRSKARVVGYQLELPRRVTSGNGFGSLAWSLAARNFNMRRPKGSPGGALLVSHRFPEPSNAKPCAKSRKPPCAPMPRTPSGVPPAPFREEGYLPTVKAATKTQMSPFAPRAAEVPKPD